MSAPLIIAGSLAIVGAVVHGLGGELLVVRKLSPGRLEPSRFGGPVMTKAMIHATWHITTVAFLGVGVALILSGTVLDGDAARALGYFGAGAATAFAAIVLVTGGAYTRAPRMLIRHPGPAVLTATAALAWWGAL